MFVEPANEGADVIWKIANEDWKYISQPHSVTTILRQFVTYFDNRARMKVTSPYRLLILILTMRQLYSKTRRKDTFIEIKRRVFLKVLWEMYNTQGTAFFRKGSKMAAYSTKFAYLTRHLSNNPTKYSSYEEFVKLNDKYDTLPSGVERRYCARLYDPEHLLILEPGELARIGCSNTSSDCASTIRYQALSETASNRERTEEEKEFLTRFGRNLKFCRRYSSPTLSSCGDSDAVNLYIDVVLLHIARRCVRKPTGHITKRRVKPRKVHNLNTLLINNTWLDSK